MQTKNTIAFILIFLGKFSFADDVTHVNIFGNTLYPGYVSPQASVIASEGGYLLDSSMANVNNQQAYSMALDNSLKSTTIYFEKRQNNMFYRDLEYWQKKERAKLKKEGSLDRKAIYKLYGK